MLYGLVAFALFVALTLLYSHWPRRSPKPRLPHILALWVAMAAALVAAVAATAATHPFALALTNLATYLALGEAYIFVYALPIGSLSIRILLTMLALESMPNPFERTLLAHSPETFLQVRLDSLVAQNLLEEVDGHYHVTPLG